jgi:hypothetical protein
VPGKEINGNRVPFRGRHKLGGKVGQAEKVGSPQSPISNPCFFRQQRELIREIHSAVTVFLIHNILPDDGHLRPADAIGETESVDTWRRFVPSPEGDSGLFAWSFPGTSMPDSGIVPHLDGA